MQLLKTTQSVGTLVALREAHKEDPLDLAHCAFVTISPNPKVRIGISGRGKQRTMPYALLPVRLQYDYCMKYLFNTYMSFLPDCEIIGSAELDKSNKVHFHFLLFHPKMKSAQQLKGLQVDIKACPQTILNMSTKKGKNSIPIDHMNSIVKSNRSLHDHILYLDKDYDPEYPLTDTFYIGRYINSMICEDLTSPPRDEEAAGSRLGEKGTSPLGASAPATGKSIWETGFFNHI